MKSEKIEIRIDPQLKEEFTGMCKLRDKNVSAEIRRLISLEFIGYIMDGDFKVKQK